MNYLECGFEVDLNCLEEQQGNIGIAKFSTGNYPFGGLERFIMVLHAFDILPTECFDGFAINQFKWTSNFDYDLIELPEKTKQYLKK